MILKLSTGERSTARRRQANAALFELVREGVVNALVHRDYAIKGAKCQLVVTPDTITVKSPGKPVEPITLEQMQSFDAPMLSRKPRQIWMAFGLVRNPILLLCRRHSRELG